jgi:hypothetical protein|tara:strand:- start:772 stop:885 length:114 start_codon:yes stop_codon:yes gene_type:complete
MQTVIMKNQGVERENENQKYQISENQELRQRQQGTIY